MTTGTESVAPNLRWDLSDLFTGIDDPKLDPFWVDIHDRAAKFEANYRGKLGVPNVDPQVVLSAIREIEALYQDAYKPLTFAHLLFAANTSDPNIGAFMQKQMELMTPVNVKLMFFELELQSADAADMERLLNEVSLAPYHHYLKTVRTLTPHRLTEPEEVIIEEMSNTGRRAWTRLFEETTSNHVFQFVHPTTGETRDMTMEEVVDLLREPDRAIRQSAADALTDGLKKMEKFLVFNYNNLIQDQAVEDRLRKHPYPEHARHLTNELDKDTVDLVVGMCRDKSAQVSRYYTIKREILGIPELTHIDRYAPLAEAQGKIPFEEAKSIVLNAFSGFSAEMGKVAEEFFAKRWIDAEPRPGKQGGAFCSYITPDTHPVVFLNYLNKMEDVSTLAHELGHGVHASLSRRQTLFNFHGTLPLAELASTFGEMLVFEKLVDKADAKDQLSLYASKIEGVFATIFRQAAMFRFEQRSHNMRREHGELNPAQFAEIWQDEMQSMFGDSVKLGDQHAHWWSYISHFVGVPFYVYAYSFGELLVLSLYQMAKREGEPFAAKYLELLAKGGSESPQDLLTPLGVDLKDPAFWEGGFQVLSQMIDRFEDLWKQVKVG